MLKGAYKKLKSYYYYNKNFILMRKKIADFEYDHNNMESVFYEMASALQHPLSTHSKLYFDNLLSKLDFYVIPKQFNSMNRNTSNPVSNTIQRDKRMKTVNFFIDALIEVHILDTLWTVFLAKMDFDLDVVSSDVYGNTINETVLFDPDGNVNFDNRVLFNRYFIKYTEWRNKAFRSMEYNYDSANDAILVSLDIKSYFYSVRFDFNSLNAYFLNHSLLHDIRFLTSFMKRLYSSYLRIVKPYRKDMIHFKKNDYILPIGLFSSMFLGNLYLKDFDERVRSIKGVQYYGRYVDDILLVVRKSISQKDNNKKIIGDLFVQNGILTKKGGNYSFVGYKALFVQPEKIKVIYLDHTESRALIDIYNSSIRIIPSQMYPLPYFNVEITNFDENAYSIENFSKENKIRDIGFLGVDSFKVGSFFSLLPRRYAHLKISDTDIQHEIREQLVQINKFFTGSQMIEFYANWLNYLYFLVLIHKNEKIWVFINNCKEQIKELKAYSLDKTLYNNRSELNLKVKAALNTHLDISLDISFSIDIPYAKRRFVKRYHSVKKYVASNMFEHSFVAFPLANYLDYSDDVSFSKMELSEIGKIPENLTSSFKFVFSPRFIHYDEIILLRFYHSHLNHNDSINLHEDVDLEKEFSEINLLGFRPFKIKKKNIFEYGDYILKKIVLPSHSDVPSKVKLAVGSIDIDPEKCIKGYKRWENLTLKDKKLFYKIMEDANDYNDLYDQGSMVLVLPELYFPIYWISDLIRFAKKTQIAIVTGLQYIGDETNRKYNYLATILPFKSGKNQYCNAYVYIREKNDYSPIELEELAKHGATCCDKQKAEYNVFYWKGIRLTPILCYELTDIMARASLKGNSDIIAAVELNPDTTYFSNIIDSAARDLHAIIIQANSSRFGDSRVTGPYNRDSKDVFKIKGGENDHVVIGTIEFSKLKDYQENYRSVLSKRIKEIQNSGEIKTKENKEKPEIKRLPARFKNK